MVKTTELIHHQYIPPSGFNAPQVPTHQASTVIFPSVAAMRSTDWKNKSGYTYGLHGTPTTFTLEERLASIEGAKFCQLVPSGLAAIAMVNLSLLKAGDEVLLPSNVYGPNLAFAKGELAQYAITHQVYDPMSLDDLALKITPRTRLVWIEAPGSVTMEFPDLIGIVKLCAQRGVISALDNTWGAGLAFNAFDLERTRQGSVSPSVKALGVDLTVQALTKYASGGGDVLMGCICTSNEDLDNQLKLTHMRLGMGVGADDVQTVLRSLPSMALRYKAQDASARLLAKALAEESAVAQVLHPALIGSPGHANWVACCAQEHREIKKEIKTEENYSKMLKAREVLGDQEVGHAASIFSVIFRPEFNQTQVDKFCDSLKYFKIGYSWGGPMSLVVPYDLSIIRPVLLSPSRANNETLTKGRLVRLCVGLEDTADLLGDLKSAIDSALK